MSSWLSEAIRLNASAFTDGGGSRGLVGRFPADIVDQTVSAYLELLPLGVETQDLRRTLGEMQRKIRAKF